MQTKLMFSVYDYSSSIRLGYTVQVIVKVWNACTPAAVLESLYNAVPPYMSYNCRRVILEVIDIHEEGHAPPLNQMCYAGSHRIVLSNKPGNGAVAQEALDQVT